MSAWDPNRAADLALVQFLWEASGLTTRALSALCGSLPTVRLVEQRLQSPPIPHHAPEMDNGPLWVRVSLLLCGAGQPLSVNRVLIHPGRVPQPLLQRVVAATEPLGLVIERHEVGRSLLARGWRTHEELPAAAALPEGEYPVREYLVWTAAGAAFQIQEIFLPQLLSCFGGYESLLPRPAQEL